MPAYHSQFNSTEAKLVGNIPILPLKQSPNEEDIVDEAISLFKANTFFRNFDIKGGGDRLLIYLILYIQDCLLKLSKMPTRIEGDKMLATLAVSAFPLPGDAAFPLNSIFEKPSQAEFDVMKFVMLTRQYFIQLRQELGVRLNEKVYYDGPKPSKWWMCFQKKKFMGISGTG